MAGGAYGIPHRRFLQGMMSRKVCKAQEVKDLFNICFTEKPVNFETNIGVFIRDLNSQIARFQMEIRKGVDEVDGSHCYCLVNCQESVLSLQATDYTPAELQYFQNLIAAIVRSENGSVSSIDALNLTIDLAKPMPASDVDNLLKRLKANKWIVQRRGKIALSTLSILEFEVYIKEMFPDEVELCVLCKQLVISGEQCIECDSKCHHHCASRVSLKACPKCRWPRQSGVGVDESTLAAASDRDTLSSQAAKKRKR